MREYITRRDQQGFSLIELMIAMVLGLMITGGTLQVFMGSRETYVMVEELARIQEGARFAMDIMRRDMRMAGATGCPSEFQTLTSTVVDSDGDIPWFSGAGTAASVTGYSAANAAFLGDVDSNTDVVVIHKMDISDALRVTSHNEKSAVIHLDQSNPFDVGDVLIIVSPDCQNVAEFVMTGPNSKKPSHIVHNTGNISSSDLGNCSKALGGGTSECNPSPSFYEFAEDSMVYEQDSIAYFIRDSSLFRRSANSNADELMEGVEDLVVRYGVDTDNDGVANQYFAAAGVADWNSVVSVRFTLLMVSGVEVLATNSSISYEGEVSASDQLLRKAFTSTVQLRNKEQI